MAKVTYRGRTADRRVLNKKDLVRHGLDEGNAFTQTEFVAGEAVEVDSAVAQLLLDSDVFAGEFEASKDEESKSADDKPSDNKPAGSKK